MRLTRQCDVQILGGRSGRNVFCSWQAQPLMEIQSLWPKAMRWLLVALILMGILPAWADAILWTNASGGQWSIPANWSPNRTPGPSDDALIACQATCKVVLDTNVALQSLTLGAGDVGSGRQTLAATNRTFLIRELVVTNGGVLLADGCLFHSSVTVAPGGLVLASDPTVSREGSMTVSGGGVLSVRSGVLHLLGPLTNSGTVNLTNSAVQIANGDMFNSAGGLLNQAGGSVNLYGDSFIAGTNSGTEYLVNKGQLTFLSPPIQTNIAQQTPFDTYPILASSPDRRTNYMAFWGAAGNTISSSAIYFTKSADGGASWSRPTVVVTNANTDSRNPALGVTSSGRLVMLYQPIAVTPSWKWQPSISLASDDGGATWTQVGLISTNILPPVGYPFNMWTPFGAITERDGRLYAGFYARATNQWNACYCLTSDDAGSNWVAHLISFGLQLEPAVLPIDSDRVLCVSRIEMWSTNELYYRFPKMSCFWSTNSGVNWFKGGDWLTHSDHILNDPACLGLFETAVGPQIAIAWGDRTDHQLYVSQDSVADVLLNFTNLYSKRVSVGVIANSSDVYYACGGYPQMVPMDDDGLFLLTWYYEGGYSDPYIASVRLQPVDFTGRSTGLTNVPSAVYSLPGRTGGIEVSSFDNSQGQVRHQALAGTLDVEASPGGLAGEYEAASGATIQFFGGTAVNPITPGTSLVLGGSGRYRFSSGYLHLPTETVPGLGLDGGVLTLGENFQGGAITNLALRGMVLTNTLPVRGILAMTNSTAEGCFEVANGGLLVGDNATIHGSLRVAEAGSFTANGVSVAEGASLTVARDGTLTIGSSPLKLQGALTNAGTISLTDYGIEVYNDGTANHEGRLINTVDGQVNFCGSAGVSGYYGDDSFINLGTLTKCGDDVDSAVNVANFSSSGRISVEKGTLRLNRANLEATGDVAIRLNGPVDHGRVEIGLGGIVQGNLTISLMDGYVPVAGDSYDVLSYAAFPGAFNRIDLPVLDAAVWSKQYTSTALRLQVTGMPRIEAVRLMRGTVTISGQGGIPEQSYVLLNSTNLALPLDSWTAVATNVFDAHGNFVLTNSVDGGFPMGFFLLQVR